VTHEDEEEHIILPWRPNTRQQQGRITEKKLIKAKGGRPHPSSGSGHIKQDGHNDHCLFEVKDALHSHRIMADELLALYQRGIRQGLIPTYMVRFSNGLILEGVVRAETATGKV